MRDLTESSVNPPKAREATSDAERAREVAGDLAAIEADLERIVASARSQWPEFSLSHEDFAKHLSKHARAESLAEFRLTHASDLYLAAACAAGVDGAAAAFERGYGAVIDSALGRMRLGRALAAEVKQRLRDRLLVGSPDRPARIASYAGKGDLGAWVRAVVTRLALNMMRDEGRRGSDDELVERVPSAHEDPELRLLKARFAEPFRAALKEALASLDARSRLVLKQHYIDGLSTEELGRHYGVHRVTVLRWLAEARTRVANDTQQRLGSTLGMNSNELQSIVRLIRSQLDVSLHDVMNG
jgi:RNA polymerase sigma-70 factor (ECF subfamily)